jgi:hypothetical protein
MANLSVLSATATAHRVPLNISCMDEPRTVGQRRIPASISELSYLW